MARDKGMLRSRACLLSSCSAPFLYLPKTLMALQGFVVVCQYTVKTMVFMVLMVVISQNIVKTMVFMVFMVFRTLLN